jgi:FkbM family methyltransferase
MSQISLEDASESYTVVVDPSSRTTRTQSECWPATLRDRMVSHCAIRLGRLNRFRAVAFVRKQTLSRIARQNFGVEYQTIYDMRISLHAWDSDVVIAALNGRILHPRITEILNQVIKPGDVVVDAGANVGFYTLLAAKRVGRAGRVISFEPDPRNLLMMQKNVLLNEVSGVVQIEAKALSNIEGKMNFWTSLNNSWGGSLVELKSLEGTHLEIASISLDLYRSRNNIGVIDAIKIDIEGAEPLALEGMRQTLQDTKLLIYEINGPGLAELKMRPMELIQQTLRWGDFTSTFITDERNDQIYPLDDPRTPEILNDYGWANVICGKEVAADYLKKKFGP